MKKRMEAIGTIIKKKDPDFIAFQEVTDANLKMLRDQRWFSRYNMTKSPGRAFYFTVILSKNRIDREERRPFDNSKMGRDLLFIQTDVPLSGRREALIIATSHIESEANDTYRREEQLAESFRYLATHRNVLFMGDTNIHTEADGEVRLPAPWCDVWLTINKDLPEESGFTFYSKINTMLKRDYASRLDRMFASLTDFTVKTAELVGNEPLADGLFPSDHFGLFVEFQESAEGLKGKSEFTVESIKDPSHSGLFQRPLK